ncbi:C-X-C chemokine receptor type 5 isoform X1 [Acanthochromis polyacanthus]|uniref:C-X-C chemokine receptor type 5 isoform X1 n=1 Tax=Acanthochromis polyacanthus TaxID=80966 RepID=UPI0022345617|nr:C-X-C chemokine receptor type 5 isoform X1 [Acanthochromis polyacanthus]
MALPKTYTVFEDFSEDAGNLTDYIDEYDTICAEEELSLQGFYAVFPAVLYSVIFLLGVTGNGLMITILLSRWRQLRITEIYLLHLALADLMLLFMLPFEVVQSITGWVFGGFFCMLSGVLTNLSTLCGSLLLACIGFDRYLAIVHAIRSMQSRRPRVVHLTCTVLWFLCLGLSAPNAVFLSVARADINSSQLSCYYHRYGVSGHDWVVTNRFFHLVCFFVPLASMSYCYTALIITLCKSQKSQAKKGAIRLALLVTIVFCVCWLPYNISSLVQTLVDFEVLRLVSCDFFTSLPPVLFVTRCLGISHCCLNPFLYAFVGVRFRNELLHLLCRLGCSRICLPFIRAQGHSRPSVSDGVTTNSTVYN